MKIIYQPNRSTKYVLLLLAFTVFAVGIYGQNQKSKFIEQTSFSSEKKISKSVKIPSEVLKKLGEYDDGQLEKCQQDDSSRLPNAAKHFAASKINLNKDGHQDLIVQAQTSCFTGAHNTTFWIFTGKTNANYELIFDIAVDYLEILKTSAKGYRDIETVSYTAVEQYSIRWKFDSRKYQKSECKVADMKTGKARKVACEL